MSILQMALSSQILSSYRTISDSTRFFVNPRFPPTTLPPKTMTIRMGGGPRTYPGGVSKWQWKRMQAKKAKQLLKARLARERQIYEMRKRAELKAAIAELERPWEVVEKAPTLLSVGADEQVKVLADRFQKPGGFDLWSEKDGPELFKPGNGLPSARFFPRGVVHSIKPYGKPEATGDEDDDFRKLNSGFDSGSGSESEGEGRLRMQRKWDDGNSREVRNGLRKEGKTGILGRKNRNEVLGYGSNGKSSQNESRKNERRRYSEEVGTNGGNRREFRKPKNAEKLKTSNLKVYDLNLQKDGSYEFEAES